MKSNEELKMIQDKLLEIMKFVDAICKKNNIEYFLTYGTCIGAIRHKGFIPWDDDLDIMMTYPNYIKFKNVMENQQSKYIFQTPDNDLKYNRAFGKVRDCTTTYIEKGNEYADMNQGLYIDVFPIVGYPNNRVQQILFKLNRSLAIKPFVDIINNKHMNNIATLIYKILGRNKMYQHFSKKVTKYNLEKCNSWISVYGDRFSKNIFKKDFFGKGKKVKFENMNLPVPEKYDEFLRIIYGNYMKIPSKEEIEKNQHSAVFIDLNKSYTEYLSTRPWLK